MMNGMRLLLRRTPARTIVNYLREEAAVQLSLNLARELGVDVMRPLRRIRARAVLARFEPPYQLHLGCGSVRFEGWVNVDSRALPSVDLVWDLRRPLPLPSGSCALVHSEHVLEHFDVRAGGRLLRECHRVLAPGGTLRVSMPSLGFVLTRATSAGDGWRDQEWLRLPAYASIATRAEMLNAAFRYWGHQWLYDEEELRRRLLEAGFTCIELRALGESPIEALRGRETRPDSLLIAEATR